MHHSEIGIGSLPLVAVISVFPGAVPTVQTMRYRRPLQMAYAPVEWNHTVMIVNKGDVEHWLNGKKLLEYQIGSDEWKKQKEAGRWKTESGYGAATSGHLACRLHTAKLIKRTSALKTSIKLL